MTAAATPAPVQTLRVGDIEVTYLPDGEAHFLTSAMFPAAPPDGWTPHAQWLDDDGRIVTTLGGFLVRSGGRTVVVDLGIGAAEMDIPDVAWVRSGRLLDSLAAAGVSPGEVDTVVYTHLHGDHVGWTSDGSGGLTFPNAEHLVGETEFEFWRANGDVPFAPDPAGVLDPLENRVTAVPDGHAVAPGITLLSTSGHTPGHQTVVLSSGAARGMILGDIVHCPAQLLEPEWSVAFDVDAEMARRTRERLFAEIEDADVTVGCSHFPEAAFGRVLTGEGRRYWQPTP